MEETSRFYRCVRQIQLYVLELAGLVILKNYTLYYLGTILTSIFINFTFSAISSVYIWTFIKDCSNKKFSPNVTSELVSFIGFHFRFMYMFYRRKKLGQMLK